VKYYKAHHFLTLTVDDFGDLMHIYMFLEGIQMRTIFHIIPLLLGLNSLRKWDFLFNERRVPWKGEMEAQDGYDRLF